MHKEIKIALNRAKQAILITKYDWSTTFSNTIVNLL